MEQKEGFSDELNLLDYWKVIYKNKKLIAIIVLSLVIVTIIVAILMPPVYEARAIIAPASQQNAPSGMSTLVAPFGIAIPSPANVTEIVNLLNSNILREKVIKKNNLMPVLLQGENEKNNSENERIWNALRALEKALNVNYKKKDNIIEISMQFKDPEMAVKIVNHTLTELTEHMSSEARRVAETNKKYLESQLNTTADPFIKAKIYSLIAQQIEQTMMAEVKENFAFKVLDPPMVPDQRIKPKRKRMVMISFMASLFLGVFVAFLKEYVEKNEGKEIMREGINGN